MSDRPTYPIDGYEPGSTTFIATFGSGQVHAGGYVEIQADNADAAYEWMSVRYERRWASLYGETEGRKQIVEWGYQIICYADIRSGKDPIIQPINELIIPRSVVLHGEIQPILRTPGDIQLYYDYGISTDQKLYDLQLFVPLVEKTNRQVVRLDMECSIYSSYTHIYWTSESAVAEQYVLVDVTDHYFPKDDETVAYDLGPAPWEEEDEDAGHLG